MRVTSSALVVPHVKKVTKHLSKRIKAKKNVYNDILLGASQLKWFRFFFFKKLHIFITHKKRAHIIQPLAPILNYKMCDYADGTAHGAEGKLACNIPLCSHINHMVMRRAALDTWSVGTNHAKMERHGRAGGREGGILPERSQWLRPRHTLRCTGDKTGRTGKRRTALIIPQFKIPWCAPPLPFWLCGILHKCAWRADELLPRCCYRCRLASIRRPCQVLHSRGWFL